MTTTLYEIRDRIVDVYRSYDYIFRPVFRFLLAFLLLVEISRGMGFMTRLNNYLLIVIIALACTLMPMSMMAALLALIILLHLYSLSMEAAALGAAIFLIVFLVFFRFAPHSAVILLLMPLAMTVNLHFAVPLAAGLLFSVGACVPTALGVIIWEYLHLVVEHRNWLRGADSVEQLLKNFRFLVDNMVHNRSMWVIAGAMAATVLVVYFIRRLAITHAWYIASCAGILTELLILVYAEYHYGVEANIVQNIPWILLSLLIAVVITFFVNNVDFTRMENVQFADDDYYYFVKAVPRFSMEAPDRKASDFYHEPAGRDLFAEADEEIRPAAAARPAAEKSPAPAAKAAAPAAAKAPAPAAETAKAPAPAADASLTTPVPVAVKAGVPAPEAAAAATEAAVSASEEAAQPAAEAQGGLLDRVKKFLDDWKRHGAGAVTDEPDQPAAEPEEGEASAAEKAEEIETAPEAAGEEEEDLPEIREDNEDITAEAEALSRELAQELSMDEAEAETEEEDKAPKTAGQA